MHRRDVRPALGAAARTLVPGSTRRRLLPHYHRTLRQLHDLGYLFLELTRRCNLDCLHCGSDCCADAGQPDLPFDDVVRVLREIAARYDARRITVVLSGGEPLCYPRVFDLGAALRGLGFPWGMVTNGWGWDDRAFALARTAHLASVTVSLDGLEPEHDWLRNRPGSWRRATEVIRSLAADRSIRAMDAVTCVNRRNLDTLDEVHRLVVDLGLTRWRLFTISPIGRATGQPDLFLDAPRYQALMERILGWKTRGPIRVELSESGYLGPCLERRVRDHDYFCGAGVRVGGVMVDGAILACPNIDRRFRQGSIFTDSFVDVWEHRFEAFRDRRWTRTGRCGRCDQWTWCQGNGMHLWDLDRHEPRLCHYEDYGLAGFGGRSWRTP